MSFFEELKRRNVFRVGIAYAVMAWVLLQAADFGLDLVDAPNWVIQSLFIIVLLGLPIALVVAWAFELTPEGIKREADVDRSQSITPHTGRKLDRTIIVFLAVALALVLGERFLGGATPRSADDAAGQAGAVQPATTDKSIAVLPFADLSQAQDQGWFADGLAEEILNALVKTPDLQVASRTSSFQYKGSDKDISTMAGEMGVAHVLEGSVRSSGERIRVTAQLIRASDGFHLWSENYDRDVADMISIQEDLASSIATALQTSMDPAALAEMADVGTASVAAYQAYLRGQHLSSDPETGQPREAEMLGALEQWQRATELDPAFAAAYARQASFWLSQLTPSFNYQGLTDLSPAQLLERFNSSINQAIGSATSEADRRGYQAHKAEINLQLREAARLYAEALEARPNDRENRQGQMGVAQKLNDRDAALEALAFFERGGKYSADSAIRYLSMAYRIGDRNAAADYGLQAMQRFPDNARIIYQAHRTLLWAGRVEEAAALARRLEGRGINEAVVAIRQACAEGRRDAAEQALATLLASPEGQEPSLRWLAYQTLGMEAEAINALRPLEASPVPFQLADMLSYPNLDPQPFPALMALLQRENIKRPAAAELPFKCPPPQQTAIAVLPFVNMSSDSDNEYFSDGVSEEILNVLAGIPELKVAARTSAFAFKGSPLGIAEIAGKLGVSHVLEGSVRKAGNQVRITAQLIQADNGFHLWSETFDRELTNIFAIQDEIAQSIASVLEVQLLGERQNYTTVHDLSPEVYEKFLKARFLMRRRNDEAMAEAIALSREVMAAAPDFPRGLVQLAEALVQGNPQYRTAQYPEIRELTDRALALDPTLAAAHMMQGQVAVSGGDTLASIRHFRRAIELDPSEPRPHHWLGIALSNAGYLYDALEALTTAVTLEPDHANSRGYLGYVNSILGNWDRAYVEFGEQARLGNPDGYWQRLFLAVLRRDLPAAQRAAADAERAGYPPERSRLVLAALQDPAQLETYLAQAGAYPIAAWQEIREYMALGAIAQGFDLALASDNKQLNLDLVWAADMAAARALPGFQAFISRANLRQVWDELGPPPACRETPAGYDCTVDNQ
jgi:TolB-like protein/Flp pilus assembly protein TadD